MKILTIIGARPQFIKASVVSKVFAQNDIHECIVHTGQHFNQNMSDIFFEDLNIPAPKYNLDINNKSHGAMTGQMLEGIESVLKIENPDWVVVYGDTNSTLAGALAASKMHIKIAHIESGLRSFNMNMPEEINRILTDRVSSVLFCPTETAITNLKNEGFDKFPSRYFNVGDVMYDVALQFQRISRKPDLDMPIKYFLATLHRAENTDNPERLKGILESLNQLAEEYPVILPLHPRTSKLVGDQKLSSNIMIIPPQGYLEMIYLINQSKLVLTDSGGLQKEAYFFKKPCVTLRDETEWTELIDLGVNILAGSEMSNILEAVKRFNDFKFNEIGDKEPFGSGNASEKIFKILQECA